MTQTLYAHKNKIKNQMMVPNVTCIYQELSEKRHKLDRRTWQEITGRQEGGREGQPY
jgi:hypothetical protein